jgi:hypothetical protein
LCYGSTIIDTHMVIYFPVPTMSATDIAIQKSILKESFQSWLHVQQQAHISKFGEHTYTRTEDKVNKRI